MVKDRITIGIISRPHGIKGFLKILPETDRPERFTALDFLNIKLPNSREIKQFTIEKITFQPEHILLKLEGINDRNQAELLRNAEIVISRKDCLPTDEDSFYLFDLIGLKVQDKEGKNLGTVIQILEYPAQDVYVIKNGDTEYMVPAVKEIIEKVDIEGGRMVINPIPGLIPEAG